MKRIILPLVIIACAVGVASALVMTRAKPEAVPIEEKAWRVEVQGLEVGRHRPVVRLYGRVDSPRTSRLTAALEADVLRLPVQEGERVQRGQLLLELDDREARLLLAQRQAELAQVEADIANEVTRKQADEAALPNEKKLLALARQAVHRARDLRKRKVASQSALDDASQAVVQQSLALQKRQQSLAESRPRLRRLDAVLAKARAALQVAELNLQRCKILAPFDGRVSSMMVAEGDRVRKGSELLEIFDYRSLRVRAQLPERVVAVVASALRAGIRLDATARLDGQLIHLRLVGLAGKVVSSASAVEALLSIEQPPSASGQASLVLGRLLDFELQLPVLDDVAVIPREAVYGTNRLYIEKDGRMHGVRVQIMGSAGDDESTAVDTSNISPALLVRGPELESGQSLVVTQLPNAIEGLRVRIAGAGAMGGKAGGKKAGSKKPGPARQADTTRADGTAQ